MAHSIPRAKFALVLLLLAIVVPGCACSGPDRRAALYAEHEYNGTARPLWIDVADVDEPSIRLLEPVTNRQIAAAPCVPGRSDLSVMFPSLWREPPASVLYAQLYSRREPVGAALVLVPMLSPRTVALVEPRSHRAYWIDDSTNKPEFEAREGVVRYYSESPIVNAGLRVFPEQRVVLDTSLGQMEFEMRPDAAPNTAINFVRLVEGGFYTDVVFHRVVAKGREGHPFVIQVGDPTGTGDGGPGYAIDMEPTTLPHDFGVISMARDSEPNTNGSQVFVCLSREGTARLDGKYCAFGTLVRGEDVVRAIAAVPTVDGTDRPRDPPVLRRAVVIPAPPRRAAAP